MDKQLEQRIGELDSINIVLKPDHKIQLIKSFKQGRTGENSVSIIILGYWCEMGVFKTRKETRKAYDEYLTRIKKGESLVVSYDRMKSKYSAKFDSEL